MSRLARVLPALAAAALLGGCNMVMRRTLDNTGKNQVVRVEGGERLYLTLEENVPVGCRWFASCSDSDVWLEVAHEADAPSFAPVDAPGKAKVEIRIRRGYDGPSDVVFEYRHPRERKPVRRFTLALYRRTGDCAFWK
ncbi:MAG: hypothetical protein ACI4RD_07620 [Kiritimatiellia bacterium]